MRALKLSFATAVAAFILAGCAVSPEQIACLQPNRRVEVELGGLQYPKPKAKKGKASAKKASTKKKKKPRGRSVVLKANVQGDLAWDYEKATLKPDGKKEIDRLLRLASKGTRRRPIPTEIKSVIITGHSDKNEVESGLTDLDEQRARAVKDYLVSKGVNERLIFWQGEDARKPMPVTKFCEG